MKGNSKNRPNAVEKIGNKYQVRWDIIQNDKTFEDDVIDNWDFNYVNCDQLNRGSIIRAIIHDKYPLIDDELAVINNADIQPEAYQEYQEYRQFAKKIADETI